MWGERQRRGPTLEGYLRLPGGIMAWRADGRVYAGRMPPLGRVRGEIDLIDLRSEESDEDPRDFGDRRFPVTPEARAEWLADRRELLGMLIEEAQATGGASLEPLRAELAALEGLG